MKQTIIDSLTHIGSGGVGVVAIDHVTTPDTSGLILKILIGVISILPSIKALFKRKQNQ